MFLFANEFKFNLLVHAFKELATILALTTTYYSVSRYPLNAPKITFHKNKGRQRVCVLQQQVPLPLPCFNFAQIAIPSLTLKKHRCSELFLTVNFEYVLFMVRS